MLSITLRKIVFIIFLVIVSLVSSSDAMAAGSLSLSPSSGTGSQFSVQVILDTGDNEVVETDVVLSYDSSVLQVKEVVFGDLFPVNVDTDDPGSGTLRTYSYFPKSGVSNGFIGAGVLMTIEFAGLIPGSSTLSFDCIAGGTSDSNIIGEGFIGDVLDCGLVVNGVYTVDGTGGAIVTPTSSAETGITTPSPAPTVIPTNIPTLTPTPKIIETGSGSLTATPTPIQELLESGSTTVTLTLSVVGSMLLIGSLVMFIF